MSLVSSRMDRRRLLTRLWQSPMMTTWASLLVRSLNLVLLIPFLLRRFTPAEISLWYLFSTVVSLNLLIDLGLSTTFVRFIAYALGRRTVGEARAEGPGPVGLESAAVTPAQPGSPEPFRTLPVDSDEGYLQRVVGTQQVLFRRMTVGVFLLLAGPGSWAVYRPIQFLANPAEGWAAWAVVVVATTIGFWGGSFAVYLQGINRIAEFRRYETLFSLGAILTSVVVLALDAGLLGLVAVNQFWAIITALRNRWLCRRYDEGVFHSGIPFRIDRTVLAQVWPAAWRSGVGVLMSYGLIQSSNVLYAQQAQVDQVSSYLFAMRIMQIIITFAQAPFYSQLPLLASLYARHDKERIIRLAQRGMMRSHWTYVAGFAGAGLLAAPVMDRLGATIGFVDSRLWALLGLAFFMERYGAMHLQLYSLTNHIVWHIANGVTGVLYGALLLGFYPVLGVYAFPLSMLLAYTGFYCWYSRRKSQQFLQISFWKFDRSTLAPFAVVSLLVIYLNR